jgi:hypothetical protein
MYINISIHIIILKHVLALIVPFICIYQVLLAVRIVNTSFFNAVISGLSVTCLIIIPTIRNRLIIINYLIF